MQIPVPYGRDEQLVTLADHHIAGTIYPNDVETADDTETLQEALLNPIRSVSFTEFLRRSTNLLVIVNDGTRPTPTAKILDIIEKHSEKIVNRNLHRKHIEILVPNQLNQPLEF